MIQLPVTGIKGMVSANKTASKEIETTAFDELLQLISGSEKETEDKNVMMEVFTSLFQSPITQVQLFQTPKNVIEETSSPVAGNIDPKLVQEAADPFMQKPEGAPVQQIVANPNRVETPNLEQATTHVMDEQMTFTPLDTAMDQGTGEKSENKKNDNHFSTSNKEATAPTQILGNMIVENNTQNNTAPTTETSVHKPIPAPTVRVTHLEKDIALVVQSSIQTNGTQEGMEATFSLHPNHLGKVDVKVSIKDGNVTAEFLASSTLGKDVLETNVHALRTALEQQGFQVDKIDVSQQSASLANAFSQKGDSQSRQGQPDSRKRSERFLHNQEEDYADFSTELGWSSQINTTA